MLHIVNKSPFQNSSLSSCLAVAAGGDVLLMEDAVCVARTGTRWEATLQAAQARFRFFVLGPDLEARGLAGSLVSGVNAVDYAGFVELVEKNPTCQSWL